MLYRTTVTATSPVSISNMNGNWHDFPLTFLEFCVRWLWHEHRLMTQLAPLCFGLPGNRRAIRRALLRGFIESHATARDSIEQGEMIV